MYQMMAFLEPGGKMPEHQHPQEQLAYILSGRMKLIVNGTPHELATGDFFYIPSTVPHAAEGPEETRVLDTFSPPRDDYLAADEAIARRSNGFRITWLNARGSVTSTA
jgi:quercetin dioxygenase-like cupin family protein